MAKDRIEAFLLSPEAGHKADQELPPWSHCSILPARPSTRWGALQVSARPTPAITAGQAVEIKASKLQWQEPRVRDATAC